MEWFRRQIHKSQASRLIHRVSENMAIQQQAQQSPRIVFNPNDNNAAWNASIIDATVVRATLTIESIHNIPPLGLDIAFGCRIKPKDARSLLDPEDSPTICVGYHESVIFNPPWSVSFKIVLQKKPDDDLLQPVKLRISVRKYKAGSTGEEHRKFGFVNLNLTDYAKNADDMSKTIRDRKLLENCPFNSILQFSIQIDPLDELEQSKQNLSKLLEASRSAHDIPSVFLSRSPILSENDNNNAVDDMEDKSTLLELLEEYEKNNVSSSRRSSVFSGRSSSSRHSRSDSSSQKQEVRIKNLPDRKRSDSSNAALLMVDEIMDSVLKPDKLKTIQNARST